MRKLFSILLFGAMLAVFSACEQRTTTTEVYQIILVTDGLEGATAKASKTNDIHFADEVRVTVTPEKSHIWEIEPEVTASNAIRKSLTEEDGVYTYVFTAFEDNSVIQVTGVAVYSNTEVNGHKYVDLGLPSGTLWATCNVGATKPEEYGDYFAWGETEPKSYYEWSTYKYCNGSYDTLTKYCNNGNYGIVDNKKTLEAIDDAATANWGGNWRMPTKGELNELISYCTWNWTTLNGVYGCRVTNRIDASKYIFLPAAGSYYKSHPGDNVGTSGVYWSSSLGESYTEASYYLYFGSGSQHADYANNRSEGIPVRPVCSPR